MGESIGTFRCYRKYIPISERAGLLKQTRSPSEKLPDPYDYPSPGSGNLSDGDSAPKQTKHEQFGSDNGFVDEYFRRLDMLCLDDKQIDTSRKFPDGTFAFKIPEFKIPDIIDLDFPIITWKYESEEEMLALYYIASYFHQLRPSCPLGLIMYYVPNGRMDRTSRDDEVFTLKFFADLINSMKFERVEILDPHSFVVGALIDRVTIRTAKPFVEEVIRRIGDENLILFYPDEGAVKRYSDLLERPYSYGIKHRDWLSRRITSLSVDDAKAVRGKRVLVIDDICCRGSTFFYSAEALKKAGATEINLYCTHCENTILDGSLLDNDFIRTLYTTDSLFTGCHPKIEVLDCEKWLLMEDRQENDSGGVCNAEKKSCL